MLRLLLISLALTLSLANFGIDFSAYQGSLTNSTIQCLVDNSVTFAVAELWAPCGHINPYFTENYFLLREFNIRKVDAYAVLCDNFTAEDICSSIAHLLPGDFMGQVWFSVGPHTACWNGDIGGRIPFIENVVRSCQQHGLSVGIHSSANDWAQVVGSQGTSSGVLTPLPVWYADYDNTPNYNDYPVAGFGGWPTPSLKQYAGDKALCGISANLDFY